MTGIANMVSQAVEELFSRSRGSEFDKEVDRIIKQYCKPNKEKEELTTK